MTTSEFIEILKKADSSEKGKYSGFWTMEKNRIK